MKKYSNLPLSAKHAMEGVGVMAFLAMLPVLGACVGLLFVIEITYSAMRQVRKCKQKEAKRRYLEKLREQSRERHHIKKRQPGNPCPSAEIINVQWDKTHDSLQEMINFGLLLYDLEPYIDNSLITVPTNEGLPRIVGRNPGVKGWLAIYCPHINYKTAMRYKSLAEKAQKIKNLSKTITKSTSIHAFQETLYKELGILHFTLEKSRRKRRITPSSRFPEYGGYHDQTFIYALRHHAHDALERLPYGSSRRFIHAVVNLAEEMRALATLRSSQ